MSFKISQTGDKEIKRALLRIEQTAPKMMKEVSKEANRRHAATYKRRTIPRDTGRLEDSLTTESHEDREVKVTDKGITIGTLVPYAKYQRSRIRELTRAELVDIFIEPITQTLQEILAGRA